MKIWHHLLLFAAIGCGTVAQSDTTMMENGGDRFISGGVVDAPVGGRGDTFLSGRTVVARGVVGGDLHVTGFEVSVRAQTGEDLYAIGGTVDLGGSVTRDMTAAGFSLRTQSDAQTGGNARLMGNTVTIEGPVTGALSVIGQDVILNAAIDGDARILSRTLTFGPDARVGGTLTYGAPEPIAVPDRVATPDRVVFEAISAKGMWDDFDEIQREMPMLPGVASLLFGFVISLLFFLVLGALFLGFMPRRVEKLRQRISEAPGQSLVLGVLGLAVLFGLVPITALTFIGLPFVPIAILAIVVFWTLGYALGAYSVAMRLWHAFIGDQLPGMIVRLSIYAAAIILVALLNFIPFVGWVVNYTLVLLGIGAMTHAILQRLIGNTGVAFDVDMQPIDED